MESPMNQNEKMTPNGEVLSQTEFGKKLDNFWYYNKWKVIVGLFIVFALVICIVQCSSRETYDVKMVYAGKLASYDVSTQNMQKTFSEIMPSSIGSKGVGFIATEIYSDEYVADTGNNVNAYVNSENYKTLCDLITTGECSLIIMDAWVYDKIKGTAGFRLIDEVCAEISIDPSIKHDDYTVSFKKTDFYKANSAVFQKISDDAVIGLCIYSPYKTYLSCAGQTEDAHYTASIKMLQAILNYKVNEPK